MQFHKHPGRKNEQAHNSCVKYRNIFEKYHKIAYKSEDKPIKFKVLLNGKHSEGKCEHFLRD